MVTGSGREVSATVESLAVVRVCCEPVSRARRDAPYEHRQIVLSAGFAFQGSAARPLGMLAASGKGTPLRYFICAASTTSDNISCAVG